MAEKKPYFFKYKYNKTNKELRDFINKSNEDCQIRFAMTLDELLNKKEDELTQEQKDFINYYHYYYPVIDSPCVMNKICKYIESIDFQIKKKIKSNGDFDYKSLQSKDFIMNRALYQQILEKVVSTVKSWEEKRKQIYSNMVTRVGFQENLDREILYQNLKNELEDICSNSEQLANHLVYLFYVDKPSYNKNILWAIAGRQIYENLKAKTTSFYYPLKNDNGSLKFLYDNFSIERYLVSDLEGEEVTND